MLAPRPSLARPVHMPFWPWPGTGPGDKWPQDDDREQQTTMAPWGNGASRGQDQEQHVGQKGWK